MWARVAATMLLLVVMFISAPILAADPDVGVRQVLTELLADVVRVGDKVAVQLQRLPSALQGELQGVPLSPRNKQPCPAAAALGQGHFTYHL